MADAADIATTVRAELDRALAPIHADLGKLSETMDGMRERVARIEGRLEGRPPSNPSNPPAPQRRSDDSDQGGLIVKLSGGGWARLGRWLLGALIPTSLGAGGTYLATRQDPPTEAPRAVTAPAPSGPFEGPQETP